ncbi:unnamed protein product [Rotaria socialis]|uniref:Uncharacterized protein n=2 Tax=Rotaria socialis TaxID=392032 RepID=A0A817M279_9BILA|nr:unnamed protein product [Rotaria socialis]
MSMPSAFTQFQPNPDNQEIIHLQESIASLEKRLNELQKCGSQSNVAGQIQSLQTDINNFQQQVDNAAKSNRQEAKVLLEKFNDLQKSVAEMKNDLLQKIDTDNIDKCVMHLDGHRVLKAAEVADKMTTDSVTQLIKDYCSPDNRRQEDRRGDLIEFISYMNDRSRRKLFKSLLASMNIDEGKPKKIIDQRVAVSNKKTASFKCPHCTKDIVYKNAVYSEGYLVTCCYDNCKRKFHQVACPHCSGSNTWKNADYQQGSVVTCAYDTCKRKFQQVVCPHCFGSIVWKNADHKEGSVVTCPYETCKRKFQHLACTHCSGSIVWKNADHKEGSVVTCPYETCKRKFQQLACTHCSGSIVWKNADHEEDEPVTCVYENCRRRFL